jgi:hypothetical protein
MCGKAKSLPYDEEFAAYLEKIATTKNLVQTNSSEIIGRSPGSKIWTSVNRK